MTVYIRLAASIFAACWVGFAAGVAHGQDQARVPSIDDIETLYPQLEKAIGSEKPWLSHPRIGTSGAAWEAVGEHVPVSMGFVDEGFWEKSALVFDKPHINTVLPDKIVLHGPDDQPPETHKPPPTWASKSNLPSADFAIDHGTHITGIATAKGLAGVIPPGYAPNAGATADSTVHICNFSGKFTINCLKKMAKEDNPPRFINLSVASNDPNAPSDGITTLSETIDELAWKHGILVVVAAGNQGWNAQALKEPGVPPGCASKNALCVGALEYKDWDRPKKGFRFWKGTNDGPTDDGRIKPDVYAIGRYSAPGYVVIKHEGNACEIGTSILHRCNHVGTSSAAPTVTAMLALAARQWPDLAGNPHIAKTWAMLHAKRIPELDKVYSMADGRSGWLNYEPVRAIEQTKIGIVSGEVKRVDQNKPITKLFELGTNGRTHIVLSVLEPPKSLGYHFDNCTSGSNTPDCDYVSHPMSIEVMDETGKVRAFSDRADTVQHLSVCVKKRGLWTIKITPHDREVFGDETALALKYALGVRSDGAEACTED